MPKEQIVTGIDIGSTKIATCVGTIKEGVIDIIGLTIKPNSGMRKGVVTDIEDTISTITAALEETERMSGVPINSAFISIGGSHITCAQSKGIIAVSRTDGEISQTDIDRVVEAAKTIAIPPNQEILHIIPQYFLVDGQQEPIKDPIGMNAVRLEVCTEVISGSLSSIRNLSKCINQAGLDINELVFTPLATSEILLTKKQKDIGVILVDIGATTTEMAVFEEGNLIHAKVFPVGSSYITNDIAIGLRTTIEAAEKIKVKHGSANIKKIKDSEEIKLSSFDPNAESKISKKYIAEIIEARLLEIFNMIKDELKNINKDGLLPGGVVLTGGGAKLEGLTDFTKDFLRLPAQVGIPVIEVSGMVDKLDDPLYTASVGLMLRGFGKDTSQEGGNFSVNSSVNNFMDKAKNIFKHFMP